MAQQQIVLFRVSHGGLFGQKEANNLPEINSLSPTSSPSVAVGASTMCMPLVVLEKD